MKAKGAVQVNAVLLMDGGGGGDVRGSQRSTAGVRHQEN